MIFAFMINALWEGALVVAVTALVLRCVSPRNASTRYALWMTALVALAGIPIAASFSHLGAQMLAVFQNHAGRGRSSFALVPVEAWSQGTTRIVASSYLSNRAALFGAAIGWAAGSTYGIARLIVSLLHIARIRRRATFFARVDGVAVLTSRDIAIPIATGIALPAIVLPDGLAHTLASDELRCATEHELAHVRRGDVATNLVQRFAEALFFWNPWIYVVGHRLITEREAACDDWAVRRFGAADDYATCLASLGKRIARTESPLLTPSVFRTANALVARIERLVEGSSPKDLFLNYAALGAVTMLFVLTTLTLQAFLHTTAVAAATPVQTATNARAVATACIRPNADPTALNPAPPNLPKSQMPTHNVSAIVLVTIDPNGKATSAKVYRSSGDAAVDRAVMTAAQKTRYSPKRVNCTAVTGTYLFRADFAP